MPFLSRRPPRRAARAGGSVEPLTSRKHSGWQTTGIVRLSLLAREHPVAASAVSFAQPALTIAPAQTAVEYMLPWSSAHRRHGRRTGHVRHVWLACSI